MPQFDILILSSQIFGLLVTLSLFYNYLITNVIQSYTEIKKFRTKKLVKNVSSVSINEKSLVNNLWLLNNKYKTFLN